MSVFSGGSPILDHHFLTTKKVPTFEEVVISTVAV